MLQSFCWIAIILLSTYVIAKACESFEEASAFLGRNLPLGAKGATIDAVGSSLPEFFTTAVMVLFFADVAGFAGGIAVTAGSAIMNSCLIPAAIIWSVSKNKPEGFYIEVDKKVVKKDIIFLIFAEVILLGALISQSFTAFHAAMMITVYIGYIWATLTMFPDKEAPQSDEARYQDGLFVSLISFDFKQAFFPGQLFTDKKAITVLAVCIAVVAGACHLLTESTIGLATMWGIPVLAVSAVLIACASSIPDLFVSVAAAKKGDYEDAISNALGSNIFDICGVLGIIGLIYTLTNGAIALPSHMSTDLMRVFIIISTLVSGWVLSRDKIYAKHAALLSGVYACFLGFITLLIVGA